MELQYNVSWEDPRVDCDLMKLNKKSSIMMLTSAGCNVLDYVIDGAGMFAAAWQPHIVCSPPQCV